MEQLTLTGSEYRCLRCGRHLTDPISIQRGYGHGCWKLVHIERPPELVRRELSEHLHWWVGARALRHDTSAVEIEMLTLLLELHPKD